MADWWTEALKKWGAALSFSYDVFENSKTGKQLATGEWFRSKGLWCVQLDSHHAACIRRDSCDESIQQALSFTLQSLYTSHTAAANEQLRDVLATLSTSSREQLRKVLQEPKVLQPLPHHAFYEPGYFFWIRFEHDDLSKSFLELQSDLFIDDVIKEWVTGGWYMWFADENGVRSILLYQTCTFMLSIVDNEETQIEPVKEMARVFAESVSAMLESDASIASTIIVSRKVENRLDLYPALAMLVVASRTARVSSYGERIILFNDHLLLHWLQLLPRDFGQLLTNWMNSNRESDTIDSSVQEVEDMLDGLVAANLNVSEAARMLYLHRNTLIHRIERVKQSTGLDIRNFFDAVQLWIAMKLK